MKKKCYRILTSIAFLALAVVIVGSTGNSLVSSGYQVWTLAAPPSQLWYQSHPGIPGGCEDWDQFGYSLAAGDFNGDTYKDLVIGVPYEDIGIYYSAGLVHVLYGAADGLSTTNTQVWHQNSPGIGVGVESGDYFGARLSVGDFNGDGSDDLAISAWGEDVGAKQDAGLVHILYGSATGLTATGHQVWHQDSPGIIGGAEHYDSFGFQLAAGDFDGDNADDLAISVAWEDFGGITNAGLVHILYGSSPGGLSASGNEIWHQNSYGILGGAEDYDSFGTSLAAGDFNADTFDDLVIGVPNEDFGGKVDAGIIHILYGTSFGITETDNQIWCQDSPGVAVGAEPYDNFGLSLAAGDYNGDTFSDLAIGTPFEDVGTIYNAGIVNVLYGSGAGLSSTANQMWHQNSYGILGGAEIGDYFGYSLAAGDITMDGRDELLVGVPLEDIGLVADSGAVNVIIGSTGGLTDVGNAVWYQDAPGFPGRSEINDQFGWRIAIGDFDLNLYNDVAMSAPLEDLAGGLNAGVVIVIYRGI